MIPGERFPNPETDSSFAKFRDSEKFQKAVAEMSITRDGWQPNFEVR